MEPEIRKILEDNFAVPEKAPLSADLGDYLEDSIDIGEFIAILNAELGCTLKIIDFRDVRALTEVIKLVEKSHEA